VYIGLFHKSNRKPGEGFQQGRNVVRFVNLNDISPFSAQCEVFSRSVENVFLNTFPQWDCPLLWLLTLWHFLNLSILKFVQDNNCVL
jgi:hypothetical protein